MPNSSFASLRPANRALYPGLAHEVKYDGYRLRLERDGERVRLITRGGYNWTDRYPWIVEAALKNRHKQFVIDGEAVVLGVDGVADFNALHSRKHDDEVQLYAFDILALDGDDLRALPLSMRKTNLARLLARRPDGIFVAPFEQGEIGPELFRAACDMGLEGLVSKRRDRPYRGWPVEALDQGEEPDASGDEAGDGGIWVINSLGTPTDSRVISLNRSSPIYRAASSRFAHELQRTARACPR